MPRKITGTSNNKKQISQADDDIKIDSNISTIHHIKGKGLKSKFGNPKGKLKRTASSSSESDDADLSDDNSDLSNISDSGDEDLESDNVSDLSDNITDEDLSDISEDTDDSNISDSDVSNPRNSIKDDEGCVHDYIGSDDEALEELENDKVKIHDLTAVDYFKDYTTETVTEKYLIGEDRITKPYLFDYERIKLLSVRTKQLSSGAKSLIKDSIEMPAKLVAELEMEHNVIPLLIERPLPNGKSELWKISELTRLV